jgi:hypothetical protein
MQAEHKTRISAELDAYFDRRVPIMVRDKVVLQYKWRGDSVTILERRPYFRDETQWTTSRIARLRYDAKEGLWCLDCTDRNGRWHQFTPAPPSRKFQDMLAALDEDATGIFWG